MTDLHTGSNRDKTAVVADEREESNVFDLGSTKNGTSFEITRRASSWSGSSIDNEDNGDMESQRVAYAYAILTRIYELGMHWKRGQYHLQYR